MFNLIAVNTNPWAQGSKTHAFAFVWGALERVKGVVFKLIVQTKKVKVQQHKVFYTIVG